MARPRKSLEQLVVDGTFRARHHHERLHGSPVPWEPLARMQERHQRADSDRERRFFALEFERLVRERAS